jgi:AcrR family transcriptional regulator
LSDKLPTKGETSRRNIIEAAYRLFLEKGYNAISIRDISRRGGLTIGGLYTHSSDKEQIFMAVFNAHHPWGQILQPMSMAQGDTIDDLLHDMARRMIEALGVQRDALNLIFTEVVEFQGQHFADTLPQFFPDWWKSSRKCPKNRALCGRSHCRCWRDHSSGFSFLIL